MESQPANPYSTPSANLYGAPAVASGDAVSPSTIAQLSGTKPWVRFMSVIAWLIVVFLLIAAAGMGIIYTIGGSKISGIKSPASPFGGIEFLVLAVIYGVLAIFYIFPGIKLWRYANRIGSLTASHSVADLDAALGEQRSFWKFVGIMTIVLICGYLIAGIGLFAYGASAALKAGAIPH